LTCPGGREGLVPLFSKCQCLKEMSMVLLTKCPKPFTGIEEHCSLDEGRSKLSQCGAK
jgi:hypothetical protein